MANKKYHYYVLVFTDEGPKYVTSILPHNYAEWKTEDKPLEMSASWAEDVYTGLCLNFFTAVLIKSRFEITNHPYNYADYNIKFEAKENNDYDEAGEE